MKLNEFSLKDKKIFSRYLNKGPHNLSVYAFENIYIWKSLFQIRWLIIEDALCVFFKDNTGIFLYLPALFLNQVNPEVVAEAFKIMDKLNRNKKFSRVENIEEKDLDLYRDMGYACVHKSDDYLCLRKDLAALSGNRFKSKRACVNYFTKHYEFQYLPYRRPHKSACLKLHYLWTAQRKSINEDRVYQGMLEDSATCLKIMLEGYRSLNITGRLVKVAGRVAAFSFGYELNKDTFCILYEVTDLSIRGLAQFIFREFCRELEGYKYINIMDDSGLQNLKKVKSSYHPQKLIPAYIAVRKHG